jgi:hypothetical protein
LDISFHQPLELKRMNRHSLHQPAAGNLSRVALIAVLCLWVSGAVCADEPVVFAAPKAYPIERYEAGWNKNPFTLKTAPTVVEQDSFAKDLAIGAYYGDAKDPSVVVVNIKTGERITLKKKHPAANGMQLKNIQLGTSRKEIVAEVTLGAQTSEVRYNDDYLKQIAGAEAARVPPGQQPGMQGQQRPGAAPPPWWSATKDAATRERRSSAEGHAAASSARKSRPGPHPLLCRFWCSASQHRHGCCQPNECQCESGHDRRKSGRECRRLGSQSRWCSHGIPPSLDHARHRRPVICVCSLRS